MGLCYFSPQFLFFSDKKQAYFALQSCKMTCLNFAVKLPQSLYVKGTILSMIDKRAAHQMYLINHSVSESMHVLLTPFPG